MSTPSVKTVDDLESELALALSPILVFSIAAIAMSARVRSVRSVRFVALSMCASFFFKCMDTFLRLSNVKLLQPP